MSGELMLGITSAAWAGLLTAISPCPLATNVAAISYMSRQVARPRTVVLTGLLYTLGRSLVYVLLALILVRTALSAPLVAQALQRHMNRLLGPVLILVGMVLLDLLRFRPRGSGLSARLGQRAAGWGVWSGLVLGVVFALTFCPASAALYFAGLLPLAIKCQSSLLLPAVFGVATALPVVVFAVLIAFSAQAMARAFDRISAAERWARGVTGVLFIVIGVYFCLRFIYGIV